MSKKFIAFFLGASILPFMFIRSGEITSAVHESVLLCIDTLLPSLFLCMVLSMFLSLSGAGDIFSCLLYPVTRYFLGIPFHLGQTVLFSLIGGYPTGVSLLGTMTESGQISREDAGTLLGMCVNPGPAFVVLTIGKVMFNSVHTGIILLISQVSATFIVGAVLFRLRPVSFTRKNGSLPPLSKALITAVSRSSSGMMTIFSYVILCGALFAAWPVELLPDKIRILTSLAEVTNGCRMAADVLGVFGMAAASFVISFGGICVCSQISALADEYGIPLKIFWVSRPVCASVSAAITFVLASLFPQSAAVFAVSGAPVASSSPDRLIAAVCLCLMIFITLSNISRTESIDF